MTRETLLEERYHFHREVLSRILYLVPGSKSELVATNADKASRVSRDIAAQIIQLLGGSNQRPEKSPGQSLGRIFEEITASFIGKTFSRLDHLRPGIWHLKNCNQNRSEISKYDQYFHLVALQEAAKSNPELAAALGNDYAIAPDIILFQEPLADEV